MDGSQNKYAELKSQLKQKKKHYCMILFIWKSKKYKITWSDKKQIKVPRDAGKDYKWAWGNFQDDEHAHYLDCGEGITVLTCRNSSNCLLKLCISLRFISSTSIKLFKILHTGMIFNLHILLYEQTTAMCWILCPKKVCWCLNSWYPWIGSYLEIESLQI